MCALKTWSEIKGMCQALCLIYNIISSVSMSQIALAKQWLMIQIYKIHSGWEWEGKAGENYCLELPWYGQFFPSIGCWKDVSVILARALRSSACRVLYYTPQNCISACLPAEVSDWWASQHYSTAELLSCNCISKFIIIFVHLMYDISRLLINHVSNPPPPFFWSSCVS